MPSKKDDPANHSEQQPADLFSSMETRAMLEEFRELVRAGILRVTAENEVLPAQPAPGEASLEPPSHAPSSREDEVALLDKQLLEWFEKRREEKARETPKEAAGAPRRVETRVSPVADSMRQKVIERVAQKMIETWDQADRAGDPSSRLREQIIDRIAEEILRRMQRNLE